LPARPIGERTAEAPAGEFLDHDLAAWDAARRRWPHQVFGRQGAREFDHVPVEKRHPVLDAVRHRHLVLAHQQVDKVRS